MNMYCMTCLLCNCSEYVCKCTNFCLEMGLFYLFFAKVPQQYSNERVPVLASNLGCTQQVKITT
jgi:hypothetical protein